MGGSSPLCLRSPDPIQPRSQRGPSRCFPLIPSHPHPHPLPCLGVRSRLSPRPAFRALGSRGRRDAESLVGARSPHLRRRATAPGGSPLPRHTHSGECDEPRVADAGQPADGPATPLLISAYRECSWGLGPGAAAGTPAGDGLAAGRVAWAVRRWPDDGSSPGSPPCVNAEVAEPHLGEGPRTVPLGRGAEKRSPHETPRPGGG
jgi:hypothetical protein